MKKQKTIQEIVGEMSPEAAALEARELSAFLNDPNSSYSHKDFIWLECLQRRAKEAWTPEAIDLVDRLWDQLDDVDSVISLLEEAKDYAEELNKSIEGAMKNDSRF